MGGWVCGCVCVCVCVCVCACVWCVHCFSTYCSMLLSADCLSTVHVLYCTALHCTVL